MKEEKKMKRTYEAEAEYATMNVKKNLERFAKRFPKAADFCEFDEITPEVLKSCLPITDKFLADGTVNNDWTYYFDIDFNCGDGMYIWYIERQ